MRAWIAEIIGDYVHAFRVECTEIAEGFRGTFYGEED